MENLNIPLKFFCGLALLGLAFGCEENETLPPLDTVGTSTATIASISVSNDKPIVGEKVVVTLEYVNISEDPAKEIKVMQEIGEQDFTDLTTLDESSAQLDTEITKTLEYTVPNVASGTSINLDMVLSSQKQFPQRERVTMTVQ